MSNEETTKKDKPIAQEPSAFGIPFADIPQAPWTLTALGHECYLVLSKWGGYGLERNGYYPDLDPRTFAYGIATIRITPLLTMPFVINPSQRAQALADVMTGKADGRAFCLDPQGKVLEENVNKIAEILSEYKKLNDYLQGFFPAIGGLADNPKIPKPQALNAASKLR